MRILAVAPYVPYPGIPHAGGEYLLRHLGALAREHHVTLVVPGSDERATEAGRAPDWLDLVLGPLDLAGRGLGRRLADAAYRRLMGAPPAPGPESLRSVLDAGLVERARRADLVELHWPEYARFASVLRRAGVGTPVAVVEHDVGIPVAADRIRRHVRGYRRALALATVPVARRIETRGLRDADLVLLFKAADETVLRARGVSTPVQVLDPWLDRPAGSAGTATPRSVLFTGAMWRPENAEGIAWFLDAVWPRVRAAVPDASLTIAGARPTDGLRRAAAAGGGVVLTGQVPDLTPYYRASSVFVAPLFTGGGLKFKVPQAMLCGLPVVATRCAVDGVADVAPAGALWCVSDDPATMADGVVGALQDPHAAAATGRAAQEWSRDHYSFDRSMSRVRRRYDELVTAAGPGPVGSATLLVCTWRRPDSLRTALAAVAAQDVPFDEVLVVVRPDDRPSRDVVAAATGLPVREVLVHRPGLVAARNAGLDVATGDVVVYLDDDAVPPPDWLDRILRHYRSDPTIGAVGGRDRIHQNGRVLGGERTDVARVTTYGRFVGSHYQGVGAARDVDILKGVNMSFRRQWLPALRADTRLRGQGAEHYEDWALSLAVQRAGLRVVFDPAIEVDHFEAYRIEADQRTRLSGRAVRDRAHNQTYAGVRYLPLPRAAAHVAFALGVGSTDAPGLALAARDLLRRRAPSVVVHALRYALHGRLDGLLRGVRDRARSSAEPAPPRRRGRARAPWSGRPGTGGTG